MRYIHVSLLFPARQLQAHGSLCACEKPLGSLVSVCAPSDVPYRSIILKFSGRGRPKALNSNALLSFSFFSFSFLPPTVVSDNAGSMWCCIFGGFADFCTIFIWRSGLWKYIRLRFGMFAICHLASLLLIRLPWNTGLIKQGAVAKRRNKYCSSFMESLYYYTAGDFKCIYRSSPFCFGIVELGRRN